jgi:hypothetical protein
MRRDNSPVGLWFRVRVRARARAGLGLVLTLTLTLTLTHNLTLTLTLTLRPNPNQYHEQESSSQAPVVQPLNIRSIQSLDHCMSFWHVLEWLQELFLTREEQ